MSKKRLWRILGVSVLAVICAVAWYFRTYPIKLNLVTLDWQVIREVKFEDESAPDIKFLGTGVTIDKITVEVQGFTYDLFPGKSRPFLTCCEVDPNIKVQNVNLFDIAFYDKAGNDITSDYELSGARIQ